MKDLSLFIKESLNVQEALKVGKKSNIEKYAYTPKNKIELAKIIEDKIKDDDPDLNDIDVSNIDDMSGLFASFNRDTKFLQKIDISKWDVSNVTNMGRMFYYCYTMNPDISNWNVGKVKDMSDMFYSCEKFDCDISKWDVSNVECMSAMFAMCHIFNQDLSGWNVSKCKEFQYMFMYCDLLDFDINKWNMSSANQAQSMLYCCKGLTIKPDHMQIPKYCGKKDILTGTQWNNEYSKWKCFK